MWFSVIFLQTNYKYMRKRKVTFSRLIDTIRYELAIEECFFNNFLKAVYWVGYLRHFLGKKKYNKQIGKDQFTLRQHRHFQRTWSVVQLDLQTVQGICNWRVFPSGHVPNSVLQPFLFLGQIHLKMSFKKAKRKRIRC